MSGDRLPCGHPTGWMLRLKDGPKLYKYCWGCIIEKLDIKEVFAEPVKKEVVTTKKTINKK